MARLTVGFLAFENGELAALRAAQNGVTSSSSSSSVSSVSSSSSVSSPSSSSSSSSVATHDTYGDTTIRPQFLLLGEVSPVIGAADIFLEEEALDVRTVTVNLMTATPSVSALLVFDEDTRYLGRASLSSGAQYVLNVQPDTFIVPRRESTTLYVRADMRSEPNGGTSGDIVEVNNFIVAGVGVWSNDQYAKASADDFPEFQTARSVPTSITNADQQESFLVAGTDRVIGAFRFEARKSDASADADITKLTFDVTKTAGVTLSNVKLGLRGFPERMDCTVSGSQIICSSIDALYGSLKSGAKILEIRADVTLPSPVPEGQTQLMLSLGSPGSITTPGAVEWTDGTTTFSWVPFDSPIARGTLYVR